MAELFYLFVVSIAITLQNIECQDTRELAENNNMGYSQVYGFIREQEQKHVQLEARLSDTEAKLETQMIIIDELEAQLLELRNQSDTTIAFTAVAFENVLISYNNGDVIQFDNAYTNIGGHYNNATGIFTCPFNGVYGFFVNGRGSDNFFASIQLMHDGRIMTSTATSGDTYEQGSAMAVVECMFGQHVWVRVLDFITIQSDPAGYTSFSGFLITKL